MRRPRIGDFSRLDKEREERVQAEKDYREGLSLAEVSALLRKSKTDIRKARQNGQLIAVRVHQSHYHFPRWQFDDLVSRFLPIALLLIFTKILPKKERSPWRAYQTARSFLFHPNRQLGERTIFEALRGRNKRLINEALSVLNQ